MGTLAFNNNYVGFVNVPAARLAEKLIEHAYPNLERRLLHHRAAPSRTSRPSRRRASSGSCRASPTRVKIISRRWGYHGVTMAAASATGLPVYHKMFAPLVPNFIQAVGPYRFRCELEGEGGPRPCTNPVGARLRRRAGEDDPRAGSRHGGRHPGRTGPGRRGRDRSATTTTGRSCARSPTATTCC